MSRQMLFSQAINYREVVLNIIEWCVPRNIGPPDLRKLHINACWRVDTFKSAKLPTLAHPCTLHVPTHYYWLPTFPLVSRNVIFSHICDITSHSHQGAANDKQLKILLSVLV